MPKSHGNVPDFTMSPQEAAAGHGPMALRCSLVGLEPRSDTNGLTAAIMMTPQAKSRDGQLANFARLTRRGLPGVRKPLVALLVGRLLCIHCVVDGRRAVREAACDVVQAAAEAAVLLAR